MRGVGDMPEKSVGIITTAHLTGLHSAQWNQCVVLVRPRAGAAVGGVYRVTPRQTACHGQKPEAIGRAEPPDRDGRLDRDGRFDPENSFVVVSTIRVGPARANNRSQDRKRGGLWGEMMPRAGPTRDRVFELLRRRYWELDSNDGIQRHWHRDAAWRALTGTALSLVNLWSIIGNQALCCGSGQDYLPHVKKIANPQ